MDPRPAEILVVDSDVRDYLTLLVVRLDLQARTLAYSSAGHVTGYLLDRDVSVEEARIRNAIYTFRVVTNGVEALVNAVVDGPLVISGHSTGGEIQFILKDALADRMKERSGARCASYGVGTQMNMASDSRKAS